MPIKKKISNNIYEIYVGYPDTVIVPIYEDDTFVFTLIGFNEVDDSPFDFSLYDSFISQIRLGDPRNPDIEKVIPNSEFILGKSDASLSVNDELHIVSEDAADYDRPYKTLWMDIEGNIGEEKKTFIKLKLTVESDVTKQNA